MINLFGRGALIHELRLRIAALEARADKDAEERRELYRTMEQNRADFRAALDAIRRRPAVQMPQRSDPKPMPAWARDVDWDNAGFDPYGVTEAEG